MTTTIRTHRSKLSGLRRRLLLQFAAITFAGPSTIWSLLATAGPVLAGPPKGLVLNDTPKPLPDVQFSDGDGRPQTLADFRGKVVLLNVWATWCLPCRTEMPTLDRLQAALGGDAFEVVALSIDRKGAAAVKRFYLEIAVQHLAMHVDASGEALSALAAVGLPATILIDAEGRELGRLMGPAEWDAPDMVAFLRSIIEQNGAPGAVPEHKEQPQ
ncbi:TlpA family protein disulfide reductase [Rhizobium laguerreae]|uniref:TlpA family protein disulfide reductase n=1 Tax=Rhizobium laguerreae TaxID=1076926 RepID=UPI0032B20BC6